MMRVLVLGVVALALSAGVALAQYPDYGYAPYGYGYAAEAPLYSYSAPPYGYTGPGDGPGYMPGMGIYQKRIQTGQQAPQQPQW